jgi:diguanylate cyclase (GGDEF)-like protein
LAPLRIGKRVLGMIYLDRPMREAWEHELVDVFANQAAVAIQNVSLYEMAALDSLTGVSTRRFFDQSFAREIRGASRTGAPLGLLVVDMNGLKGVNDVHGHVAGDRALTVLGTALRHSVRATDLVGRLGGDEFAVLLPATDEAGVALVATRVRAALDALSIVHEGTSIAIRASVGAAVLEGGSMDPQVLRQGGGAAFELVSQNLYRAADRTMYEQKHRGVVSSPAVVHWIGPRASTPVRAA